VIVDLSLENTELAKFGKEDKKWLVRQKDEHHLLQAREQLQSFACPYLLCKNAWVMMIL
jgi:hypothetical protein